MICVTLGLADGFFKDNSKASGDGGLLFADGGTSKNCSSDWLIIKNVTKTVAENGTEISSNIDSGVYANKPETSLSWDETFEWTTPFTIEFDVVQWERGAHIRINDKTNDASKSFATLGVRNGSHVKIISTEESIVFNVDGKNKTVIYENFRNAQIGFRLMEASITYKNFKIY